MGYEYSDSQSEIHPYELDLGDHTVIGQIIRACAEIENIVTLWLCKVAQLDEGQLIFLAPRMQITAKIEAAGKFTKFRGGEWAEMHKEAFCHEDFQALIKCRNVIAHGSLLGKDDDDYLAFRVTDYLGEKSGDGITVEVIAYSFEKLVTFAALAQVWVGQLESNLKLEASRKKRRAQPLGSHPKAKRKPSR